METFALWQIRYRARFPFLLVIDILSLYSSEWNPKRIKKLLWGWKRIKNRGGTHAALILYYLAVLLAVQQLTAVIRHMYRGGLNEGCQASYLICTNNREKLSSLFSMLWKYNMSYSHITTAICSITAVWWLTLDMWGLWLHCRDGWKQLLQWAVLQGRLE